MPDGKLGAVEARFADLVWENAPIASRELARLCEQELGWKRTTTYNVLRKLCDRGLFLNDGGTVKAKLSRESFTARRGRRWSMKRSGLASGVFRGVYKAARLEPGGNSGNSANDRRSGGIAW